MNNTCKVEKPIYDKEQNIIFIENKTDNNLSISIPMNDTMAKCLGNCLCDYNNVSLLILVKEE